MRNEGRRSFGTGTVAGRLLIAPHENGAENGLSLGWPPPPATRREDDALRFERRPAAARDLVRGAALNRAAREGGKALDLDGRTLKMSTT